MEFITRRRAPEFAAAAGEAGVLWAGLFALGIGVGVLTAGYGFAWWVAPAVSAVMVAGSVECILVGMLAVGAPIGAIALTTLLVNSRHLFYGLTFPLRRVTGRLGKAYSVFALCDEAYALMTPKDPATLSSRRILWTQAGLHASWALGALAGGLVGSTLLAGLEGMDFVLTALFTVLTLDALRASRDWATLGLAAAAALAAQALAPGSMLVAAMGAFTAALVVRHRLARRRAAGDPAAVVRVEPREEAASHA